MKNHLQLLSGTILAGLLAGCASKPVAIAPVGPEHVTHVAHVGAGRLRVFTATETHAIGDNTYYYPHTAYHIYDTSGRSVKWVQNHIGSMDETPELVSLPEGRYTVVAQSESYGRVTVPIVIADGHTTVLYLDRSWKESAENANQEIVRLPDGEPIGWGSGLVK